MPGLSDPGQLLIQEVIAAGHEVDILPGRAVTTALLAAGVKAAQFAFLGFLPQRKRADIAQWHSTPRAIPRLSSSRASSGRSALAEAAELFGERKGAVCFELTKKFQRVERGTLHELAADHAEIDPRGEAVVVIGGANTLPKSYEIDGWPA